MSTANPILLPVELPIPWEQPDDERLLWHQDRMHFPNPLTRIDDLVVRKVTEVGINHAYQIYNVPMRTFARRFWAYHYSANAPVVLPQERLEVMGKQSEEKLGEAMGQLQERWEANWLPEIKQHLAYWESFDLQSATTSDLLAHLDATLERMERVWQIHFEIAFPMMLAISLFDEFYQDVFESESPFAPYRLLRGFENKTVECGRDLWELSRTALASSVVRQVLEEQAVADVIAELEMTDEGRVFLTELLVYLNEHGHRGEIWGVSYPSWIEDPTPVIKNLKDYVAQPDRNPDLEQAALVAERDQAIAEARERLQGYPAAVRDQFESMLRAAQVGTVLSEDHGYWIDFRSMYEVRRVFMELGRRFVEAGAIQDAGDVFHLTLEEILETARQEPMIDRTELVVERKAEIERYRTIQPPPVVGTQPPGAPPDTPGSRMSAKFWGAPPAPPDDSSVLKGAPGSSGLVRGRARIVRSLAEAAKLRPGDVLVAQTTSPPWTPLFRTAAAVVTDTGGILSHCAVVAREYGIPAVVGVGMATVMIADDQLVEVDGDQGIVRIVADNGVGTR